MSPVEDLFSERLARTTNIAGLHHAVDVTFTARHAVSLSHRPEEKWKSRLVCNNVFDIS